MDEARVKTRRRFRAPFPAFLAGSHHFVLRPFWIFNKRSAVRGLEPRNLRKLLVSSALSEYLFVPDLAQPTTWKVSKVQNGRHTSPVRWLLILQWSLGLQFSGNYEGFQIQHLIKCTIWILLENNVGENSRSAFDGTMVTRLLSSLQSNFVKIEPTIKICIWAILILLWCKI